jgi:hypothetical protein
VRRSAARVNCQPHHFLPLLLHTKNMRLSKRGFISAVILILAKPATVQRGISLRPTTSQVIIGGNRRLRNVGGVFDRDTEASMFRRLNSFRTLLISFTEYHSMKAYWGVEV